MMNLKVSKLSGVMLCFALALTLSSCATNQANNANNYGFQLALESIDTGNMAAEVGNAKEIRRMLADGAPVYTKAKSGRTPLHDAVFQGNKDVAELLVAKGADVNAKDDSASTPLHYAAAAGRKDLVELLVAKGADINAKNNTGVSPLYLAAKFDRAEAAELLITRGADVNTRTKSGYTPLFIAATEGNQQVVKVLLDHGADANARDVKGWSPLLATLELLLRAVTLTSSSPTALLKQKSMDGAVLQQRREAFHHLKDQWREVAMLLIDHAADVNADVGGDTSLFVAAFVGDKDLVEALIKKGADVNGSKDANETPLHTAIAENHRDVAKLLIDKGANVNAGNFNQHTPLHYLSSDMDDRNLAELMIEHGADVNARDKIGNTPLTFAIKAGNNQVVEVLRQHGGK